MTDQEMWKLFMSKEHLQDVKYEAWAFGGDPDGLAQLVLDGIKTGTASAYPLYELKNEPLPETGSYSVILDSKDEAVCMIQTTKVYVVPFNQVSKEHAYKEGEGDRSLSYWARVHEDFFSTCMSEAGKSFEKNMLVVCEEFKVVFRE